MKRYFDVYVRRQAAVIDLGEIASGVNILEGFDRLELLDAGAKISLDSAKKDLGDGTTYADGEKVEFECGTLKVTKAEWEHLREQLHNRKCDILFFDPLDNTILVIAYRVQVAVTLLATAGETYMIKLSGTRNMSNTGATDTIVLMAPGVGGNYALVTGVVTDAGGEPIQGAHVTLTDETNESWSAETDAEGRYQIYVPAGDYVIAATLAGYSFPELVDITATVDDETVRDIQAEV